MIANHVWFVMGTDENPNLHDLAGQYRINYRTLQGYRQILRENPAWLQDQGHATDQYVFTEEQKKIHGQNYSQFCCKWYSNCIQFGSYDVPCVL